jgi:hypothetical protein
MVKVVGDSASDGRTGQVTPVLGWGGGQVLETRMKAFGLFHLKTAQVRGE